jgi:hypothetical protein
MLPIHSSNSSIHRVWSIHPSTNLHTCPPVHASTRLSKYLVVEQQVKSHILQTSYFTKSRASSVQLPTSKHISLSSKSNLNLAWIKIRIVVKYLLTILTHMQMFITSRKKCPIFYGCLNLNSLTDSHFLLLYISLKWDYSYKIQVFKDKVSNLTQ